MVQSLIVISLFVSMKFHFDETMIRYGLGAIICSFIYHHPTLKQAAQRHQKASDSVCWPKSSFEKQGSGPDRGRSPVEWGKIPYVRTFVCLSVHLADWT